MTVADGLAATAVALCLAMLAVVAANRWGAPRLYLKPPMPAVLLALGTVVAVVGVIQVID